MQEPSLTLSLLPFLTVTFVFALLAIPLSRRKGKSIGYPFWCLVPFATPFILFYLASLIDKSMLDRLAALEGKPS
jgi:hypothetical protein